ncbi:MAG: response regulator [Spirochaetaceae bacterium]|nr:MAG: response regulator [Spirochaetaceae bacterium]
MHNKKAILIVEDEDFTASRLRIELEDRGYIIHHVTTGDKAVQTIVDRTSPVDLILMDMNLGSGIDGPEAARQILNEIEIPIVFLTIHTEPEVVEKTEKIASYGYVVKGSGITVIDASIKMALKLFEAKTEANRNKIRFHQLFYNSPHAVALHEMIYDDIGASVDYRFIDVNPMFEKVTGLRAEEVVDRRVLEVLPGTEQHWIDTLGTVARTGVSVTVENYARALDKYVEVTAFQPEENQVATIFADITQRKKVEEELRNANILLKTQQETAPYGVLVVDKDDRITSFNHGFADLCNISDVDLARQYSQEALELVLSLVPDPDSFVAEIVALSENRQIEESKEIPLRDGRTLLRYSYPMFSGQDNYYGRIWYYQDVTERKHAEEEIQRQLSEKEALLREVHHRIKNNMNMMIGVLSMEAEGLQDPAAVAALQDASSRFHSMAVLYDQLYRAELQASGSIREYLPRLLDSIIAVFPQQGSLTTLTELEDVICSATVLSNLGFVLNEIVTNSMKHAFQNHSDPHITVKGWKQGERYHITFADNGSGIPEDFDFAKLQSLGMMIVSTLVEQMSGSIYFERDNGTRVEIEFPLTKS